MKKILLISCAAIGFCLPKLSWSGDNDLIPTDMQRNFDMNQRYLRWEKNFDFSSVTEGELKKAGKILRWWSQQIDQFCLKAGTNLCRSISGQDVGFMETYFSGDEATRIVIQTLNIKFRELTEVTLLLVDNMGEFLRKKKEGTLEKSKFIDAMRARQQNIEAGAWSHDPLLFAAQWNGSNDHPFSLVDFIGNAWPRLLSQVESLVPNLEKTEVDVQNKDGYMVKMPLYKIPDNQRGQVVPAILGISVQTLQNALPCAEGEECIKNLNDLKKQMLALEYQKKDQGTAEQNAEGSQHQANECQENLGNYKTQLKDKDRALADKDTALRLKEQEINALKNQALKGEHVSSSKQPNSIPMTQTTLNTLSKEGGAPLFPYLMEKAADATYASVEGMKEYFHPGITRSIAAHQHWYTASEVSEQYGVLVRLAARGSDNTPWKGMQLQLTGREEVSVSTVMRGAGRTVKDVFSNGVEGMGEFLKDAGTSIATAMGWGIAEYGVSQAYQYVGISEACSRVAAHQSALVTRAGINAVSSGACLEPTTCLAAVGVQVCANNLFYLYTGWDDIKTCYSSVMYKKKTA